MKRESIFRQVFIYNNFDTDYITMTEKSIELGDIWDGLDKQLTNKLASSPDLLDLFERYKQAYQDFASEQTDIYYERGLKLGMLLGMELLTDLPS